MFHLVRIEIGLTQNTQHGDSRIFIQHLIHLAKFQIIQLYKFFKKRLRYQFGKKYQNVLELPRGGGYFIWKPEFYSTH